MPISSTMVTVTVTSSSISESRIVSDESGYSAMLNRTCGDLLSTTTEASLFTPEEPAPGTFSTMVVTVISGFSGTLAGRTIDPMKVPSGSTSTTMSISWVP